METRLAPRVNISLRVDSKIDTARNQHLHLVEGNRFSGSACNISALGVGIRVKHFLPKGLILDMEIDGAPFGLKNHIKVKSEICHCNYVKYRTYECGLKFLNISQEDKKAIKNFVSAHDKREERRLDLGHEEGA